jgi:hypothetical protein
MPRWDPHLAEQLVEVAVGIAVQGCPHREHVVPQHLAQAVEGIQLHCVQNVKFAAGAGSQVKGALDGMAGRRGKISGDENRLGACHLASSFTGVSITGW